MACIANCPFSASYTHSVPTTCLPHHSPLPSLRSPLVPARHPQPADQRRLLGLFCGNGGGAGADAAGGRGGCGGGWWALLRVAPLWC